MAETGHDLMGARETCEFFGGKGKPIDKSTLYRGVQEGRYPPPIKFSKKMARWRRSECEVALQRMIAQHEASRRKQETGT